MNTAAGELEVLSNEVLFGMLSESPDLALALGIVDVAGRALPAADLPDFSEEGNRRRQRMMKEWASRLGKIAHSPAGSSDDTTRQVLDFIFERGFQYRFAGRAGFACDEQLDPVTHITGVHSVAVEMFARDHPLGSVEDARCYVERLAKLPLALTRARATLAKRRVCGFVAPRIVLERAIADIRNCMSAPTPSHIFFHRLSNAMQVVSGGASQSLLERAAAIIDDELRPAYAALLAELAAHVAVGREGIGAVSCPGGEQFYAWRFAGHTTSSMSPEEAHAVGRQELTRLQGELREGFAELNYHGTLAEAFEQLAANDAFEASEEGRGRILEVTRATVSSAKDMMRPLFNLWPAADVRVEPIAREHEQSMHSTYVPPHSKTGASGIFWINLAQSASQPRSELAIVSFHETWPGHHLQLTLAQEAAPSPLRRALLFNAYLEGWAKYAEALPASLGLVSGPLARVAALRSELYSTANLVLDTGVHTRGWTFDQALRFFVEQTGGNARLAEMVVYRSVAEPAQLCSYKMGLLTVRELRERFQAARGAAFRLQDFHDAVLSTGALPLEVLERTVMSQAINPAAGSAVG